MIFLLKLILSNYRNQEKNLINLKQERNQLKAELEQEKLLRKVAEDSFSEKETLLNQKSELASNAYLTANNSISSIENSFNQSIDSLKGTIEENIQESYSNISGFISSLDDIIKQFEDLAKTNQQTIQAQYEDAISKNNYAAAGQLNGLAAGYGDAATKFSYIRSELIQKLLKAQISSYQNNLLSSNGYVFTNTKSQILNVINSWKNNLNSLYSSSQGIDNNNNPGFAEAEIEMMTMQEVQDILSYPWRIIDVWRNSSGNWFSYTDYLHTKLIEEFVNSDNSVNVTYNKQFRVFYHLQSDRIGVPKRTEDLSVIHTSKMLNLGNMHAIIRSVKNGGMSSTAERAVIPPNNTVISFYKKEGEIKNGEEYLTYWDRIFLDTNGADEIYLVISGLQIGESVPYGYRQMPSQWDKFVSNNPGGVKINIKRETENQFYVYYCEDDNVDANLGTLFKFSLDRENKEIIGCVDCIITVEGNNGPVFETQNKLDPNS